ncbi:uncharacterized protein LOC141531060 isoform X1 [Cotesia typhae]|uniref:uncharacterized protein LOC141531060 isoform X1 n=1 Tax=Cotesia typhae TaxID=2053667 RepID=UPI003D69B23A
MASKKVFDRCCNPFELESHFKKIGLRPATDIMKVTLGLDDNYLLCSSCRKKASELVKQQTNARNDPSADDVTPAVNHPTTNHAQCCLTLVLSVCLEFPAFCAAILDVTIL